MQSILEKAKSALEDFRSIPSNIENYDRLSAAGACEIIFQGKVVRAKSAILGEEVYWVFGEAERRSLLANVPDAVIYTWDELEQLASSKPNADHLLSLHRIKKILGAKIESVSRH